MFRSAMAATFLLLTACAHAPLEGCRPATEVLKRANAIAQLDWSDATDDGVAEIWPGTFDSGSHNSGFRCEPCTGSAEYLEQGRIISGRHLCSALLLFGENQTDTGCRSYLSVFVIHHTLPTEDAAWQLATDILRTFAGRNTVELRRADVPIKATFMWEHAPSQGINTVVDLDITHVPAGYLVWIRIHRLQLD